jgi:hypothetical protein
MELPSCLLWELMLHFSVKEIYSTISCINTTSLEVSRDLNFLKALISRDLGLTVGSPDAFSCRRILRSNSPCYAGSETIIDFYGFASSGALDYDAPHLWVRNMFEIDEFFYSTCGGVDNVNCAAVLEAALACHQIRLVGAEVLKSLEECFQKPSFPNRPVIELIDCLNALERTVRTQIPQRLDEFAKVRDALASFRSVPDLPSLTTSRSSKVLCEDIGIAEAEVAPVTAVIHSLAVSREGHFTCPVATLIIFCSDLYFPVDSPEFSRFNNFKTHEAVRLAREADPLIPALDHPVSTRHYTYCEFATSSDKLRPIVWLKFNQASRENAEIKLSRRFTGKFLYVKLIDCENRMSQFERVFHPEPNIDVRYVVALGQVVKLN